MKRRLLPFAVFFSVVFFSLTPVFAGGDEVELRDGTILYGDVVARSDNELYLSDQDHKFVRIEMYKVKGLRLGPRMTAGLEDTESSP